MRSILYIIRVYSISLMYTWYNGLENDDPGGLDEDGQDNVDDEDEDSDEDDIKITIDHKEIDDAKTSYQVIMKWQLVNLEQPIFRSRVY